MFLYPVESSVKLTANIEASRGNGTRGCITSLDGILGFFHGFLRWPILLRLSNPGQLDSKNGFSGGGNNTLGHEMSMCALFEQAAFDSTAQNSLTGSASCLMRTFGRSAIRRVDLKLLKYLQQNCETRLLWTGLASKLSPELSVCCDPQRARVSLSESLCPQIDWHKKRHIQLCVTQHMYRLDHC